MGDVVSAVRKARARAEAAQRDHTSATRVAGTTEERAKRARLAQKKARKESKKAGKEARKARKAADAARKPRAT